ncbi:MAG: nucleotidyl transferase AbiEii/AbiGii toxin family protein [Candidatus Komeilibacteria bacterium]|nr:nucleotidyl transferase AbiEii/AbiGii toxin family protein [Candidatus Komeilibacteria bacterium]
MPRNTKKALDFLSKQTWLKNSKWYLAGGTALALLAGHRCSVDLDFFLPKSKFDEKKLLGRFVEQPVWKTNFKEPGTVYGELFKAKVSFIAYPVFIPKGQPQFYGFVRILPLADIAVMKVIAISQRGRKRDFFDLYWCAKNNEPLINIIKRLKTQYPLVAHDYHHLLKSLVYFDDAENDPQPMINFKISWKEVKKFFQKEIPIIAKKLIELA